MDFKVQFFKSTKSIYDSIIPDEYTFYYTTDTRQVFLGDLQLSNEDFGQIWGAINNLTQRVNELEANSIKMRVTEEGEDTGISDANTFYVYYNRSETNAPDIKIGDGTTQISQLPFLLDGNSSRFEEIENYLNNVVAPHIGNDGLHIRQMEYIDEQDRQAYGSITERNKWNNRITTYITEDCLNLDNGDIIVQNNTPRRIRFKY